MLKTMMLLLLNVEFMMNMW